MPLIFVTHHDGYDEPFSEYTDTSVNPAEAVFIMDRDFGASGVAPRGLTAEVARQVANDRAWNFETFASHLADQDECFDYFYCGGCDEIEHTDDSTYIDGEQTCESCASTEDYTYCDRCEEAKTNYTRVGYDYDDTPGYVCSLCQPGWTSYCNICDVRYWDTDSEYHDHDTSDDGDGCDCGSPKMEFSIPLTGLIDGASGVAPRLMNDERFAVDLDRDTIAYTGQNRIVETLDAYFTTELDGTVGTANWYEFRRWITVNGWLYKTDRGTYARRLRSTIYSESKKWAAAFADRTTVSLPNSVVEKVGQIAREWSTPKTFNIEITRDLNLSRDAFAHSGSCWWTDYAHSRCTLKSNGGFGLRSFDEDGNVTGRAWVLPFKAVSDAPGADLVPTLSTEPDAYVVFNSYGEIEERDALRIMAHLTGWTSKNTTLPWGDDQMYINGDAGDMLTRDGDNNRNRLPRWMDRHADLSLDGSVPESEQQTAVPVGDPWAAPVAAVPVASTERGAPRRMTRPNARPNDANVVEHDWSSFCEGMGCVDVDPVPVASTEMTEDEVIDYQATESEPMRRLREAIFGARTNLRVAGTVTGRMPAVSNHDMAPRFDADFDSDADFGFLDE